MINNNGKFQIDDVNSSLLKNWGIINDAIWSDIDNDSDTRTYFGPVNLSKFRIRLLNDKGLILNLNNMDWSFSIIVTQLYQY